MGPDVIALLKWEVGIVIGLLGVLVSIVGLWAKFAHDRREELNALNKCVEDAKDANIEAIQAHSKDSEERIRQLHDDLMEEIRGIRVQAHADRVEARELYALRAEIRPALDGFKGSLELIGGSVKTLTDHLLRSSGGS